MKRLKPEDRKALILEQSLALAEKVGLRHLTRDKVSEVTGLSGPAINYHFGSMPEFMACLVKHAIQQKSLQVCLQAYFMDYKIPKSIRTEALESL